MSKAHEFSHHEQCEWCPSTDGMAVHTDGYKKCYVCGQYGYAEGEETAAPVVEKKPSKKPAGKPPEVNGNHQQLRGVSQKTMETMRYFIGTYKVKGEEKRAHLVAVPFADGKGHAATKIRLKKPNGDKDFRFVGDTQDAGLIFQDRFPSGGKRLVITEGEFDALSIAEVQQCDWPVVSLPNGVDSVQKAFTAAYKFINSFDEVVLWFDNDEAGQAAALEAANLLPVGKAKIAKTPQGMKDANELLQAGEFKAINSAIWGAEKHTPARFVAFDALRDRVLKPVQQGIPWIFKELNDWTYGRRDGEVYFFGAGTGVGKTDVFTQQAAADIAAGRKVALFSFEQTPEESAKRLSGKYAGKRFHVPDAGWTQAELIEAFDELAKTGTFIYDHWGSADWETVEQDITQLAMSGYTEFYIDHLTAFAAHAEDERKMLEATCASMATIANKLRVRLYVISHLSTPEGKPHEEGGRVFIRHFKGSRAIGYWAHFMFGIERDTQAKDDEVRKRGIFRCLKDRYTGTATGKFLTMLYDAVTGLQRVDNDWKWPEPEEKGGSKKYGFQDHSNADF